MSAPETSTGRGVEGEPGWVAASGADEQRLLIRINRIKDEVLEKNEVLEKAGGGRGSA
ncbi:MAG TPA: hypothetical protein VGN34_19275 [Ktedonobacteraceae bacterium]